MKMRAKIYEKLLIIFLALATCVSVCACGSREETNNDASEQSTSTPLAEDDSSGIEYVLSDDGSSYVVHKSVDTIKHAKILDEIDGIPVTKINSGAFYFKENLKTVEIPQNISKILGNPFEGCASLESIIVDKNNAKYHSNNNCLIETETKELISGCKKSVIPDYVISIGSSAFRGCNGLTSIKIPDGVTNIWDRAFKDCSQLKRINIPASVLSIHDFAFENCIELINVEFAEYGLNNICQSAFEDCKSLKKIHIPHSVTTIDREAFQNCENLKKVEIPKSVIFIDKHIFDGCRELTDVYCEWEEKHYNWRSNWLGNSTPTVHWDCEMSESTDSIDEMSVKDEPRHTIFISSIITLVVFAVLAVFVFRKRKTNKLN